MIRDAKLKITNFVKLFTGLTSFRSEKISINFAFSIAPSDVGNAFCCNAVLEVLVLAAVVFVLCAVD